MKIFKSWSMKTKIIALSFLTVLITGGGAWLSLNSMAKSYEEAALNQMEVFAVKMSEALAAQFFERYGDVQAFAINDAIRSGSSDKMTDVLNSYVALYGIYDVIIVVDRKGQYVGSNSKDAAGKDLNIDAVRSRNYSNEKWFQAVVTGQTSDMKEKNFAGTYFEDFIEDKIVQDATGKTSYGSSFSAAIRNDKGDILGVISNRAGERWLQPDIQSTYKSLTDLKLSSAEIIVFNEKGQYLQEYADNKFGSERLLKKSFFDSNKEFQEHAEDSKKGFYRGFEAGSKEEEIIAFSRIDSPKWIDQFGWIISIHVGSEQALHSVEQAKVEFAIYMAIACLLAITAAVLFAIILSKAFNSATNQLSKNSNELNEASIQIAAQSTELSESATEQAAALQETMSAVDEISAMVEKNAESATRSKEVSENSKQAAERGRGIVDQMIEAMNEIDASNNEISRETTDGNQQLGEITKLINDIGSKTKVINEIVFQTKLLSFNASVEAARAGEYGKGFSVVAEEVGNLAQMSGNAAKEISALLDESVRKVNHIVAESKSRVEKIIHASKVKVENGAKVARECNEALEEILTNVASVDGLVSEIAVASSEQSAGIKEISKAVGQLEQVTQQNSTVAQESSLAAEKLRSQAAGLNAIVEVVSQHVNGGDAANSTEEEVATSGKRSNHKVVAFQPKTKHVAQRETKKASGSEYVPSGNNSGFGEE